MVVIIIIVIVISVHRNTAPKESKFISMCVKKYMSGSLCRKKSPPDKKEIAPGRPAFFFFCARFLVGLRGSVALAR